MGWHFFLTVFHVLPRRRDFVRKIPLDIINFRPDNPKNIGTERTFNDPARGHRKTAIEVNLRISIGHRHSERSFDAVRGMFGFLTTRVSDLRYAFERDDVIARRWRWKIRRGVRSYEHRSMAALGNVNLHGRHDPALRRQNSLDQVVADGRPRLAVE